MPFLNARQIVFALSRSHIRSHNHLIGPYEDPRNVVLFGYEMCPYRPSNPLISMS